MTSEHKTHYAHRSIETEAARERLHTCDTGEKERERMGQSERKKGRWCEKGHEEIRALTEWLTLIILK